MMVLLWVGSILLALVFGASGVQKLVKPRGVIDRTTETTIGLIELAGAIGLLVPASTDIAVFLTPLAAFGFVALMLAAMIFHVRRSEKDPLPAIFVLGLVSLLVGLGWVRAL